jgi:hypothetical protein
MTSQTLALLIAFGSLLMVMTALSAYAFGWWWRGRHERDLWPGRVARLRREWEWDRRLDAQLRKEAGPPALRVVK